MNPKGTLNRIIDPPETPHQKAAREAEEKARRDRERETEAQRRNDRRLLQTYQGEDDIEKARDRELAEPGRRIAQARQRLSELDKQQKGLDEKPPTSLTRGRSSYPLSGPMLRLSDAKYRPAVFASEP